MKRNKIINNNSNASTGANANVSVDDTIATFANRLPANNIRRKQSLRPNQSHFPYFLLVRFFILFTFAFITIALVKLHFHLADIENRHAAGIYDGRSAKHSTQITNGQQPLKNQPLDIKISKSNIYESNERIPGRGAGSKRGKVHCDSDVSSLVSYWNNPLSDADREFQSPFLNNPSSNDVINSETRYLSFEPDKGGWNNIRMEFEIMVVLAAATGRTLILPPDHPFYLLQKDKEVKQRGLQHFFHYQGPTNSSATADVKGGGGFNEVVKTISTQAFFQREVFEKHSYSLPTDETNRTKLLAATEKCDIRLKSPKSCIVLYDYMAQVADYVPDWQGEHHCLIMDDEHWWDSDGEKLAMQQHQKEIKQFCAGRSPAFYNDQTHNARLLHFRSHSKDNRLLVHFYAFVYFTNPMVGNYYKRMVRDRVRYANEIFCAGGKIIKSLLEEAGKNDNIGGSARYGAGGDLSPFGGYSSMHIRRGDFQWPKMRISAEEWYENTKSIFRPGELIYIATDEANRTFFDPLAEHYQLRFLSDYNDLTGMEKLDPNFMGMIDQVVSSRGRVFVGTYFSSFSGFIGRIRGYFGISGKQMYYGYKEYMTETHKWVYPKSSYSAREFPIGWVGIEGDTEPTAKDFY